MNKHVFTDNEFAHLGEGEIAYVRKIRSDDLARSFPRFRRLHRALNSGRCSAQAANRSCFPMCVQPPCRARMTTNCAR